MIWKQQTRPQQQRKGSAAAGGSRRMRRPTTTIAFVGITTLLVVCQTTFLLQHQRQSSQIVVVASSSSSSEQQSFAAPPPPQRTLPSSTSPSQEQQILLQTPNQQQRQAEMLFLLLQTEGTTLKPSLATLAKAAFLHVQDLQQTPILNSTLEEERCHRYYWTYNTTSRSRRRRKVYWGANIADDSWDVVLMAAMEYRDMLAGIVFVESNRTQSMTPRTLRFPPGSARKRILESQELWGPHTKARVAYYEDPPGTTSVPAMARENYQRNVVFGIFKNELGMQPEDLAIIGDPDEFLTRDFLYAIQTCEIPEFRPNNDCMSPKLKTSTLVMESTPQCVVDSPRWHQPAIIVGECVDQIGDVTLHPPVANRTLKHTLWTRPDHWEQQIPPGKLGPLWDATDFRHGKSVPPIHAKRTGRNNLHTAVHLHNFFASFATLRHKYVTYGHPIAGADRMPLHKINGDLGTLANCLTRTRLRTEKDAWVTQRFDELLPYEHRPIALQRAPAYAQQRHDEFLAEYQLDRERLESGKSTTVVA